MFATGIECSNPTIDQGRVRVDQLASCGFYDRWREDFDLVEALGICYLRYGPPIHHTWIGAGRYDWSFADETFGALRERDIVPITDLCHFGVPDWIGNFQNPELPALFADYCEAFARRYPWVQLYTPVNEMYICALFSARYGWWNEQLHDDRSFVTALKHIVRANMLGMHAILGVRADALFIQSESSEYFHASNPSAIQRSEVLNSERFLSLDLNYGRRVDSSMFEFLMDNGMTTTQYHELMRHNVRHHCILGNDYYVSNEHRVASDGSTSPAGEVFGYATITREYYMRYRLPIMHTETNLRQGEAGDESVYWLWKEWANVLRVRNDGIPIVGFTWYSLIDQTDWDVALREKRDRPWPVGLYDLQRKERPVGHAYRELIDQWRSVLPTQSVCLQVPVVTPGEHDAGVGPRFDAETAKRADHCPPARTPERSS